MGEPTNFYPVLGIVKTILFPIFKLVSEWLKDLLEEQVKKWYQKALQTENPWDDFFIERLAYLLSIDLSDVGGK